MTELLDPKYDYIFKRIFGTEEGKPQLISLLNALLRGEPKIKSLELNNPEITKILENDKTSRLDIKATSDDGTLFDIEIQCRNTGELPERAVHYMANLFPRTVHKGDKYNKTKVISIWILGESVTKRQNAISNAYMTFQPQDPDPYERMTDSARIIFVELEKFNPKNADMHDLLTGWLSFLKDPVVIDKDFLKDHNVSNAMETLKYISADDTARQIYEARRKTMNDHNSELTVAYDTGVSDGEKIGEKNKAMETAKRMLQDGLKVELIVKYSGLTQENIEAIKENK